MKFVVYFLLNFLWIIQGLRPSLKGMQLYNNNVEKIVIYEKPIFLNNPIKPSKIESIKKIIRIESTIPTLLLCFSGGWIRNPVLTYLFTSKTFLVSSINTVFVMYVSMIINDIFDLELDKHNDPTRPLVTGEIKVKEAIAYTLLLTFFIEYSAYLFLPLKIHNYLNIALLNVFLYTPFLKKITIFKNISCAWLVSFSIYFSGLSASYPILTDNNMKLLAIVSRLIFFGSFMNEVLLDIRDCEGDKLNNIITIPVKYGNEKAWWVAFSLLSTNLIWNSFELTKQYGFMRTTLLSILFTPFYANLWKIKQNKYSLNTLKYFLKESTKYLFLILVYLCSFAKK
jgi:geranylgeranylglycerol-phosphate geranylgeranyltransferase